LEKQNSLKRLKVSNNETFGASHFHIKYTQDDRLEKLLHSMTTAVNPTDYQVVGFLEPNSDGIWRELLLGSLSTATTIAFYI
jgi:hypothetical protein